MVYAINHSNVSDENVGQAHWVVRLILFVFIAVCVFDPADQILGGKVFVFGALWGVTLIKILLMRDDLHLPPGLVVYVAAFIAIPLLSIFWYYLSDGRQPFEGFALLRGYLLISLAVVLAVNKVDLLPQLSAILTALACLVIAVFIAIQLQPDLYGAIRPLGEGSGLLILDRRTYAKGLTLLQVYFVTTPMLVVSIAYYFDRVMSASGGWRKFFFLSVTAINIAGMLLAGSRNNILVALLLPFLLWPQYTKRRVLYTLCSVGGLALLALPFTEQLQPFFDPAEYSNSIKLLTIEDYGRILGNPVTLLFGSGLGAYEDWTGRPIFYVTELTYFEIIRNFGLVGGLLMIGLLLLPVIDAFRTRAAARERSLAIAYLLYLLACFSNPNLFSSMGIPILAILLNNVFQRRNNDRHAGARGIS
jgi:hypothetical protein